ncbi:MAG: hypothetical protein GX875_10010 [Propionibacterium sp.]|nr:hypothetical protein [Propionibacterium sp.]
MKAITIRQPWAWAVIHADKTVENRSRNIAGDYRGLVAIHAGLKIDEVGQHDPLIREAWTGETRLAGDPDRPGSYHDVPWRKAFSYGRVIGVADLVDAHHATDCYDADTKRLIALYNSGPEGRKEVEAMPDNGCGGIIGKARFCSLWAHDEMFHLVFANPRLIVCPVPVRGQLGLWTLPDDIEQAVRRRL